MTIPIPELFSYVQSDDCRCLLRNDVRSWLEPRIKYLIVEEDSSALPAGEGAGEGAVVLGGRGGVTVRQVGEHRVVVRQCRRGGFPAYFVRDLYFGFHPRPFAELVQTERLRSAGVPVAEIYAAVVRWVAPGCYKGWIISKLIDDTETLWAWVQRAPETSRKQDVLRCVAMAVRRLHAAGVVHPDLNLNNILVSKSNHEPRVWLLDFDRSLQSARIGSDIERLERSVHKLDPQREYISGDDFTFLRRAYAEAECE